MLTSYNETYYINSSISNYTDYRKKKFDGLANDLFTYFNLNSKKILDYGAATGGLISSLKNLGCMVKGVDISIWAVEYGRQNYNLSETELTTTNNFNFNETFDKIIMLDVLEHLNINYLNSLLEKIYKTDIIIRIPVSKNEGEDFVLDVSKNDKTHIQIHDKIWWCEFFKKYKYSFKPLNLSNIYDSEGVMAGELIYD